MIHIIDTFNGRRISSHRTIDAATKADAKFAAAVARKNGSSSYIPTEFRRGGTAKTWRTESELVTTDDIIMSRACR